MGGGRRIYWDPVVLVIHRETVPYTGGGVLKKKRTGA